MFKMFLILAMSLSFSAFSQEVFNVKKSLNKRNVLHFKVNIKDCKIQSPAITNYWVMGETDGHIEDLTPRERRYFAPKISYESENEAIFTFGAIEMIGDLPNKDITVRLENCVPKAYGEINKQEIQLQEIYVAGRITYTLNWITHYMLITGLGADGTQQTFKMEP